MPTVTELLQNSGPASEVDKGSVVSIQEYGIYNVRVAGGNTIVAHWATQSELAPGTIVIVAKQGAVWNVISAGAQRTSASDSRHSVQVEG